MATVLEPTTAPPPPTGEPTLLKRPTQTSGLVGWLTTIDHKRIGILYGVTAFVFFLAGGIEALLIRLQLAQPDGTVLSADAYNQMFTMHGTTMIFLVVMPMSTAFFNFIMPIQIGARDVAFPRLNAFSYWTFLLGGLFMYSSFFLGGAPNGGWFGYVPQTSVTFSPGKNIDFWVLGLQILGIASTVGAVNFITTILNMRAPGMTLMRMPIFSWMTLISSFLLLFAMPVITIALFLLMFDRNFGSHFFDPGMGGNPLLWQHLFWLFGHPEVYILILPAMGMVSEILPVFSRKPLFGYPVMVFSGIAIGFMGWGVWVHHMFATGLGPVAISAFSLSTMFIAVPTGVKIFNWIGTMWGGSLKFTTAMLFAVGFVAMFTIGGLSGVSHAVSPHDRQQTDTYYIVAHFHYVLFGGALFGIMGGIYYWWPKVFGWSLSEKLGKWHFWTWLIGFNLTFGPMHIIGLQGMPRRIYTYGEDLGLAFWNLVATIGAFVIAVSTLVFMWNVWHSRRHRVQASADPWDGRTLEWSIPSPVPAYNFKEAPTVHSLDDWWHRKYTEDDEGRLVKRETPAEPEEPTDGRGIHMPSPSYYPLVASCGLPIIAYGMVFGRDSGQNYVVAVLGGIVLLMGLYAWALEPSTEPDEHHEAEAEVEVVEEPDEEPAALTTGDGEEG
ncbi:MAG TPA: cytochrome c oxidase subunit I [Acidimicrobiales bacterium]|nr:cytochrome c oxidase subunit I [Acidimicrobiales bacterium]